MGNEKKNELKKKKRKYANQINSSVGEFAYAPCITKFWVVFYGRKYT